MIFSRIRLSPVHKRRIVNVGRGIIILLALMDIALLYYYTSVKP